MLTEAAAARLGVAPATLRAEDGLIVHAGSERSLPFGDLVEEAMALLVPENPTLRPEGERRLTGRAVPRLDTPAKITGRAIYSIDARRDGMLYGAVKLAPVFSAERLSMPSAVTAELRGLIGVGRQCPVFHAGSSGAGRWPSLRR